MSINIKMICSFLIVVLSLFAGLNLPTLADPKANGEECDLSLDDECTSTNCVSVDGMSAYCVECVSDDDCDEGFSCINNNCS